MRWFLAFMFTAIAGIARAEMSAGELIGKVNTADPDTRLLLLTVLDQTANGLSWANTYVVSARGDAPLYCAPAKLAINAEQNFDILRGRIQAHAEDAIKPYGLVMLFALQDVFPCKAP